MSVLPGSNQLQEIESNESSDPPSLPEELRDIDFSSVDSVQDPDFVYCNCGSDSLEQSPESKKRKTVSDESCTQEEKDFGGLSCGISHANSKLVAELKKELKARGLSTVGNKTDLMERLHMSLQGGSLIMDSDLVVADSEEILDEDEVLADEEALDDDIGDISGKTDDIITDDIMAENKRKVEDLEAEEKPAKKITLNRNSVSVSEKENHQDQNANETSEAQEKKIIKISALSMKERLEMRAKKFGVTLSVDAKKEARAARFGTSASASSGNVSTNLDVLKKRAERFGTSVSSVMSKIELDEKLKKRQERFGVVQPSATKKVSTTSTTSASAVPVNSSLEEKKRQRAARFKLVK
ncbi:SAP domain-containing ribonucleoprotein isoform X5 [Anabrus simplex]|uniref:SAP domain-containing ribonucleoprotein isoform X5 n=1 Tax=Anabrus simplex TaxID=316456 RepID=UPI0035A36243